MFYALLTSFFSTSQVVNFVNNGSFEQTYDCNSPYYTTKVKYWMAIDSVSYCGNYLSVCNGYIPYQGNTEFQYPRTGNTFILATFYNPSFYSSRGYFKNRMKSNLIQGKTYCVKFYVNIANTTTYGMDGFGIYFGGNLIDTITKCTVPLSYINPQVKNPNGNIITDTLGWVPITGTFVANGTEKYALIGNFKANGTVDSLLINPTNLPLVFTDVCIDDVSCIDIDLPASAGSDTYCIPGNSVYIGRPQDIGIDEACTWYNITNTNTPIGIAAGITVSPVTTNTYIVKQDICGNIKWDTVVVYISGLGNVEWQMLNDRLKIGPNPANDVLQIELNVEAGDLFKSISIYNNLGRLLREEEIMFKNKITTVKTDELPNGVYFLKLNGASPLRQAQGETNTQTVSKRFVVAR